MTGRKTAVLLASLGLMLTGCADAAPEEPDPSPDAGTETEEAHVPADEEKAAEKLASMSTADKAGQIVMMEVRVWNGQNFTEINDETAAMFAKYHFGGVCLFSENITADNDKTISLIQDLQSANMENGGVPLLVSADQEGGLICRLTSGSQTPGNMAMAATGDPDNAYEAADIIGRELNALGFNTDFAPDTDVNSNPSNPVIGVRSFSDDPKTVPVYAKRFTDGLAENKVIPTLKHFPGHGDTATDSHTGLPRIEKSREELYSSDLIPFAQMIENGYEDIIMSAHIQFPEIETETYTSISNGSEINLPATLSRTFLTDILRGELGFKGAVITDAMGMDAIAAHFDPMDAAALALNAGADMLLMPVAAAGTGDLESVDAYMSGLIGLIEEGTVPMERVDEAVQRILTLKYRYGLMDEEYGEEKAVQLKVGAKRTVGSPEHHEAEIAISDEAAVVLENSGILPVDMDGIENVLLVGMSASQANALGYGYNRLCAGGIIPDSVNAEVINGNYSNNYGAVYSALGNADLMIITDSMYTPDMIDFSSNPIIPYTNDLISAAKANGVRVIAVSCALPYDLSLIEGADALLAVFNQAGVNECDDYFLPTAAYGPNLIGAMDVIFGKVSPKGKLPVDIPAVRDGQFTDEHTYERGYGLTWQ